MDNREEIRPYWGEEAEVTGEESVRWYTPPTPVRRATFQERHEAFVADGLCPACKTDLDESGFCSICGFSAAKDAPPVTPEMRDDYVTQLPIPLEEYAPCSVDDGVAA